MTSARLRTTLTSFWSVIASERQMLAVRLYPKTLKLGGRSPVRVAFRTWGTHDFTASL